MSQVFTLPHLPYRPKRLLPVRVYRRRARRKECLRAHPTSTARSSWRSSNHSVPICAEKFLVHLRRNFEQGHPDRRGKGRYQEDLAVGLISFCDQSTRRENHK